MLEFENHFVMPNKINNFCKYHQGIIKSLGEMLRKHYTTHTDYFLIVKGKNGSYQARLQDDIT